MSRPLVTSDDPLCLGLDLFSPIYRLHPLHPLLSRRGPSSIISVSFRYKVYTIETTFRFTFRYPKIVFLHVSYTEVLPVHPVSTILSV